MCDPVIGCPAGRPAHRARRDGTALLVAVTCAAVLLAPHATLTHRPGQPAHRPRPAQAARPHAGGTPSPAAVAVAARAVAFALAQLGKPYRWGDEGPATFDCSGLAWAAYQAAGLSWARATADTQRRAGPNVTGPLLPGDLVFYHTARMPAGHAGHVGVYVGAGRMVEAPGHGARVRTSPVRRGGYLGATRPALLIGGAAR